MSFGTLCVGNERGGDNCLGLKTIVRLLRVPNSVHHTDFYRNMVAGYETIFIYMILHEISKKTGFNWNIK